jgi:uncharacterized protein (DUF952 family)
MTLEDFMDQIAHICSEDDWQAAQELGEYRADSLESEGFIHFSKPGQAVDTANRYYTGRTDLMLLWVDPAKLTAELRWETSHGDVYPHLYGPLNLDAVSRASAFHPDAGGDFRSLPETG